MNTFRVKLLGFFGLNPETGLPLFPISIKFSFSLHYLTNTSFFTKSSAEKQQHPEPSSEAQGKKNIVIKPAVDPHA